MSEIADVRRFNRAVAQRIGALNDRFLGRDRPLGEARLLFEIGLDGAEARALRARLDLDSGYLSRLLAALERQGLIENAPSDDARVRRVRLTKAGRAEMREIDRRSDRLALSLLDPLTPAQRARLLAAMGDVERLLLASALEIEPANPASADARACVAAYFAELAERFDSGYDPAKGAPAGAAEFTPPRGMFLLARAHGNPLGCISVRTREQGVGEIKRLWLAKDARGLGLGRRLLDALESQARTLGLHTLRLDTNRALVEAQALYKSAGYAEIPRYNDEAYAHHLFEKRL